MTVFAILCHDDPEMVRRLSAALAPHPVYIHVDARRPIKPFTTALESMRHVRFIHEGRVAVNWGGLSQVDATMRLYREILPNVDSGEQIVLLSGHCYPLRPVAEIVGRLRDAKRPLHIRGARYAELHDRTRTRRFHFYDQFPVRQQGVRRIVYGVPRKIAQTVARVVPRRFARENELVVSSQWTVLTAGAISGAIAPAYETARRRFKFTFAPEEIFFATAIYNSRFAAYTQDGVPVSGLGERTSSYSNLHLLDDSMVKTYTIQDWAEVSTSEAAFVRKVSTGASTPLLDALDGLTRTIEC